MARLNYVSGMTLQQKDANGETNYYLFGETTFNGSNGQYFKIVPNFEVLEMNQDTLKTKIRVYLDWISVGGSGSGSAVKGYINGNQLANTYTSISKNQSRYMGSLDIEISHDQTTGQGSIDITCLVDSSWNGLGDAQSTTKIYTNTYPRASSVSATSGNIEENIIISINRASESFRHTLYYSFGSLNGIVFAEDITDTSYSWQLPSSLYEQIPNDQYGTGTITCITKNGSTEVGRKSCPFTVYANESKCRPDISMTVVDTNEKSIALTGTNTKLIKFVSNAKVTLGVSGRNSASIVSSSIYCGNGQTVGGTSTTFNGIDSNYFKGTTTDSRKYPNSIEKTLEMIPYIKLTLNPTVYRPIQTGSEIKAKISGNYFNDSFGAYNNILNLKYRYREKGGSYPDTYTSLNPQINDDNTYILDISLGTDFDYKKSYEFEFIVEDKISTIPIEVSLARGIPVRATFEKFFEYWGIKSFSISEDGNTLIINGDIKISGSNKLLKNL